jgi:predicted nucleotidyltransferase
MERLLEQLCGKLRTAYGDRLVAVVLYGSAASGDHQAGYSDYNVLCVLSRVTPAELVPAEPIFRWWREQGSPAPLLIGEDELDRAADCFPMEFRDIQENHRILAGRDAVGTVQVSERNYRGQVEHELRAKLLRLRQKAAGMMSAEPLLARLLTESVGTFCILFRHALRLAGADAPARKREALARAAEVFAFDAAPFAALLDGREGRVKPHRLRPAALLGPYLAGISQVIDAVDRLDK